MVYLDNAATTQPYPAVLESMQKAAEEIFGNPSSLHDVGLSASRQLQAARATVAGALHATAEEILFGPSGTFCSNLAIIGGVKGCGRKKGKIVTTVIEHASVAQSVKALEDMGWQVQYCAPDIEEIRRAIDADTVLVSVMMVNNETGQILPVDQIAGIIRANKSPALFHIDAVQAFGKLPIDVRKLGCDLMTVSAHKIHGPKGAAALYVKKGVRLCPVIYGGGQEKGLVSGTQNLPAAVGFAKAVEISLQNRAEFWEKSEVLCRDFTERVKDYPFIRLNRGAGPYAPYILNISFIDYVGENVLHFLAERGISVSVGSACSSNGHHESILSRLGADAKTAEGAVRVSFGRQTTKADLDAFFAAVEEIPDGLLKKYRRT